MARPGKNGLDYFPLDVDMDDKLELIEAKYDLIGFGIIIKLFQKIYKEGYYINWTEELQLLFCKRVNVDINRVNVIINDAIKYGIFDKKMFETYEILTSTGIQKRYFEATKRRKEVEIIKKYIIVNINTINVNNNLIDVDNKKQIEIEIESKKETEIESKDQQLNKYKFGSDFNIDELKERMVNDRTLRDAAEKIGCTPSDVQDNIETFILLAANNGGLDQPLPKVKGYFINWLQKNRKTEPYANA